MVFFVVDFFLPVPGAYLRFIRNVLLWGDPETAKGEMAPELLELQKQAQGIMMERPLPRGTALSGGSKSMIS